MKYKFNPLTWEFNLVPDSGTLKQKLNWLTGNFNLTKDASKYKQIYNAIEGEFNLRPATTQVIVHWVWSIQLTNAVENWLLSLKAFGWTEQSNLPKGYTQLEYVTFDKTYIDSWIIPTTFDYEIETKYKFNTITAWPNCARWYMVSSGGNIPRWLLATYSSEYYSSGYLLNANTTSNITGADTDVHVFKWVVYEDNGTARWSSHIDWEQKQDYSIASPQLWETNVLPIYIGWRNNSGTAWNWGDGNLYYHKVTKAGVVIQHLIPCKRNSDNEVGLYDLVTNTFFENDWNGTITAWPNAVPTPEQPMNIISNNWVLKARHQSWLPIWYTLLDYIQSWWSNYIDTWIKLTNEDIVEIQYLQTADKWAVYWEYNSSTSNMNTTLYWNTTFYVYGYNAWWNPTMVWNYDTNVHTVVHNFVDWYIDFDWVRTNFTLPNPNSFTNTLNCPIFWRSNGSSIWYFSKTKLYYFRIRRNWTLILDLIPAKDSNNNVWMYDRVSWTLFTESWSWSFTAWNTVSDPMTVYADWTIETIWVQGKNLFDKNASYALFNGFIVNGSVGESTNLTAYGGGDKTLIIKVAPNTTYTITRATDLGNVYDRIRCSAFTTLPSSGSTGVILYNVSNKTQANATFTTLSDTEYVAINVRNTGTVGDDWAQYIDAFQLEKGSTATEYQPYFDGGTATAEMLLKVGDYQDEQEILSWNIVRKVGVQVFDGTENWKSSVTGKFYIDNYYMRNYNSMPTLCTHYEAVSASSTSQVGFGKIGLFATATQGQSSARLVIGDNNYTSVDDFKAYLSQQYQAGTPIIVLYPLIEQTTETVSGQPLDIPAWDSIIEITQASLDDLELEATYEQEA